MLSLLCSYVQYPIFFFKKKLILDVALSFSVMSQRGEANKKQISKENIVSDHPMAKIWDG